MTTTTTLATTTVDDGTEGFNHDEITEGLSGFTAMYPQLAILDVGNVVVQRQYSTFDGVKLISGCCSGFEPLFSGYVGKGMLMAAVHGDVLTAPSVSLILRTIRELNVNHVHGILVIIQGNIKEQLNFNLAVVKAKAEKIRIKLLLVSDICMEKSLRNPKTSSLPGVLLVQKIAGAMAENKELLNFIHYYCKKVAYNMSTVAVSLKDFTKQTKEECICKKEWPQDTVEFTGGSEDGEKRTVTLDFIPHEMLNMIIKESKIKLNPEDEVVVLLGNMGEITKKEEWTMVKQIIEDLKSIQVKVIKCFSGSYINAKHFAGLSLTVLKVFDKKILEYLNAPTNAPAWVHMQDQQGIELTFNNYIPSQLKKKPRIEKVFLGPNFTDKQISLVKMCISFACEALISCEEQMNIIDTQIIDGTIGTRMAKAAKLILQRLNTESLPLRNPFALFEDLANISESTIGGTVATLYSILFHNLAIAFSKVPDTESIEGTIWLKVIERAIKRFKSPCVERGQGTMLDPLLDCAIHTRQEFENTGEIMEAFGSGIFWAEEAIRRSAKGKYPDPGAHAVGIWMRAVYEAIKLQMI